jgi:hypothetical protein
MKRAIALGLSLMLVLAACRDSTRPDDSHAPSDLRFAYTSSLAKSGDFHVRGGIDSPDDSLPDSSFVLAAMDSTDALVIVAVQGNIKDRYNVVFLNIADGAQPTAIQLDSACVAEETCGAYAPIVVFGLEGALEDAVNCSVIDGAITITSVTRDRVRGTVKGSSGKCFMYSSDTTGDFRLTNGAFDVALLRVKDFTELPDVDLMLAQPGEPPIIRHALGSLLQTR